MELQKMIDESNNIVFFGGAGVSTESGIKDFRSKDGLYNMQYNIQYKKVILLQHNNSQFHISRAQNGMAALCHLVSRGADQLCGQRGLRAGPVGPAPVGLCRGGVVNRCLVCAWLCLQYCSGDAAWNHQPDILCKLAVEQGRLAEVVAHWHPRSLGQSGRAERQHGPAGLCCKHARQCCGNTGGDDARHADCQYAVFSCGGDGHDPRHHDGAFAGRTA